MPLVAPPEPVAPAPAAPEKTVQALPPRRAPGLRAAPIEAVVATPPTPDDPGPEAEEEPRRRFGLFG